LQFFLKILEHKTDHHSNSGAGCSWRSTVSYASWFLIC